MTFRQLIGIAGEVVAATQRRLPAQIREPALRVPVCFEPHPNDDILAEGWEPDSLGLFVGPPHSADPGDPEPLPSQILLFLENMWDYAEGDKEVYRKKHLPAKQADVQLKLTGMPSGKYRLEIRRTGYEANDAYSAYLDMGMPKDPTPAQFDTLFQKASDSPETSEVIEVTKGGQFDRSLPMRENDTVYVSLKRI